MSAAVGECMQASPSCSKVLIAAMRRYRTSYGACHGSGSGSSSWLWHPPGLVDGAVGMIKFLALQRWSVSDLLA